MVGPRFLSRVFAAGALLVFAVCARADALRADFSPLTLRPRTNAPALFDLKLHRAGAGLLEGALEITFEAGGDVVLRQRTQDLTLAAGTQSFRIITPPLPPHESYTGTEARLRFVTKTAAVDLGRFPAEAAGRGTRNFVIAVCDTHAAGARDVALWQSLRLESFFPTGTNADKLIVTSPAFLAPEDFPTNPLALFAFDLVLLDGDGFALLREKQLVALTRWVEAGGSLCVLPGRGLKDEHLRFLNAFASAKNSTPFQITDSGEFVAGGEPRFLRGGFGRVVVASHPEEAALATPAWRQAATFLWKFRKPGPAIVDRYGRPWDPAIELAGTEAREEARRRTAEIEQLLTTLLPQSTRLLSPGTLTLILAGFLLVVGPLDWFVLGVVRRRRWTWIVFPLASAGFTALVIFEAGRALGHEDHRSALIVTDVGQGGRVLRESRFELLLSARNRDATTEIQHAFAVPTLLAARTSSNRASPGDPEPVGFSGQMGLRFTMRQQLRQWTPQFNRITSLEVPDDASGVPWAEVEDGIAGSKEARRHMAVQARFAEIAKGHPDMDFALLRGGGVVTGFGGHWPAKQLEALCSPAAFGISRLIARTAPDAAGNFDDLPLLDPNELDEWLLVISRRTPDGVHLYRRLFRTDE